jgi:hypothetical protein
MADGNIALVAHRTESLTWADGAQEGRFSSLFRPIVFSGRSSVDRFDAAPF